MQARPLLLAFAVLAAPLVGCLSTTGETKPGTLDLETIETGTVSHIEDRQTHVVRNWSAWQTLWTHHYEDDGSEGEAKPVPHVDFDNRTVVAAFMGTSPDACHEVRLDDAAEHADRVAVTGRWISVEADACAQQITYPFAIATLPASDKPVHVEMANATVEPETEEDDSATETNSSVPVKTIEQGSNSEITSERHVVVRDQTAWRDLWREHRNNTTAQPPDVNFDETTVLGVFEGESPNTCHAANVTDVVTSGDDATAHVVYRSGEGMACGMQVTHPYHLVQVPRLDGDVTFDVEER